MSRLCGAETRTGAGEGRGYVPDLGQAPVFSRTRPKLGAGLLRSSGQATRHSPGRVVLKPGCAMLAFVRCVAMAKTVRCLYLSMARSLSPDDGGSRYVMESAVRLIIADDHAGFRAYVAELLAASPGIEVVGLGATCAEALSLASRHRPTIALLDLQMPGGGIEAVAALRFHCPQVKSVIFSFSSLEEDFVEALRVGARGYILKGLSGRRLVAILRAIACGATYVPRAFLPLLLQLEL